jgi:chemotaxis protein methyltransferase WspC
MLARMLRQDGLLFAGHAEAGVISAHGFASAQIPMAFAFRHRPVAAPRVPRSIAPPPRPARTPAPPRAPTPARPFQPAPPVPGLGPVWHLVNAGRLEEAAHACQAALHTQGPGVEVYLLLGLIHDARGDGAGAAGYYRKVLYLDPNHAEALDHLALLMRKQGDEAAARRLTDRLRRQSEVAR